MRGLLLGGLFGLLLGHGLRRFGRHVRLPPPSSADRRRYRARPPLLRLAVGALPPAMSGLRRRPGASGFARRAQLRAHGQRHAFQPFPASGREWAERLGPMRDRRDHPDPDRPRHVPATADGGSGGVRRGTMSPSVDWRPRRWCLTCPRNWPTMPRTVSERVSRTSACWRPTLRRAGGKATREYATAALRYKSRDVTRDRVSGKVVSGDADRPTEATELWTFTRQNGTDWKLSAIRRAHRVELSPRHGCRLGLRNYLDFSDLWGAPD